MKQKNETGVEGMDLGELTVVVLVVLILLFILFSGAEKWRRDAEKKRLQENERATIERQAEEDLTDDDVSSTPPQQ